MHGLLAMVDIVSTVAAEAVLLDACSFWFFLLPLRPPANLRRNPLAAIVIVMSFVGYELVIVVFGRGVASLVADG